MLIRKERKLYLVITIRIYIEHIGSNLGKRERKKKKKFCKGAVVRGKVMNRLFGIALDKDHDLAHTFFFNVKE